MLERLHAGAICIAMIERLRVAQDGQGGTSNGHEEGCEHS